MKMFFRFPAYIKYIFSVYLAAVVFFTIFRIAFAIAHFHIAEIVPSEILAQAFLMGFHFDTTVTCYIIAIPFFILATLSFFKINLNKLFIGTNIFFLLIFTISFLICGIDIPYFTHFNNRFTHAALFWFDTPGFILKLIFTTPVYYLYLSIFIAMSIIFFFILNKIRKKILWTNKDIAPQAKPFLFLAAAVILFFGVRGRIELKSPIRWGTAFFSDYSFANQLGLNPVFTLVKSTVESYKRQNQKLNFMNDEVAISSVRKILNVPDSSENIERYIQHSTFNIQHSTFNVVLVLMESMSVRFMKTFGNEKNLTPVLDSLYNVSWAFTNFFSAGNHTFNGVYSTLFGMPALLAKHPMKDFENMNQKTGIANELSRHGYGTMFMCTHDEQFDNMGGYMKQNGFQKIISQKDYKKEEILSTLGVPDHILFREVIEHCRNLKPPFFTAVLTASNHPPVVIPESIDFSSGEADIDLVSVQYADWSIGQFLKNVQNEKWFDSTIFIFLADHGRFVARFDYDFPIAYHHIPLIIYAPKILEGNKKISQPGEQIDVLATLMGILKLDYTNRSLGVDIINEKRDFVFFNEDNNIGCLNDSLFYIQRECGFNSLYFYKKEDLRNYIEKFPDLAAQMKNYAESMFQAAQFLREK